MVEKLKKWAWGICLILGGIIGFTIAVVDNDPATKPDINQTVKDVKKGVDIIRTPDEAPAPAETAPAAPAETVPAPTE